MTLNVIGTDNHKSLRQLVYEELKRQILRGNLVPGTRIMEVDLAAELGVSRTPVREAIRKLEEEGLVRIEPRHGAYIAQVSKTEILHILELRVELDGMAAFYAAKRAKASNLVKIGEAAVAYAQAAKTLNTDDMIKYDSAYHTAIVEASQNKTLMSVIKQLKDLMLRFRYLYYYACKDPDRVIESHSKILAAIREGDENKARELASAHVEKLQDLVFADNTLKNK